MSRNNGSEINRTIWIAKIKDEEGFSRKIKVETFKKEQAIRFSKQYCCFGERVIEIYDGNMNIVWQEGD